MIGVKGGINSVIRLVVVGGLVTVSDVDADVITLSIDGRIELDIKGKFLWM